jgi:hypothetical protein
VSCLPHRALNLAASAAMHAGVLVDPAELQQEVSSPRRDRSSSSVEDNRAWQSTSSSRRGSSSIAQPRRSVVGRRSRGRDAPGRADTSTSRT